MVPSTTDILVAAAWLWASWCSFPSYFGRAAACFQGPCGLRSLVDGGGAEAGVGPPTIQLLLFLESHTVVHLDALLQLPSQSSELCHQVAQVTAQRDLVTGIPGGHWKKREEESDGGSKHLSEHSLGTFLSAKGPTGSGSTCRTELLLFLCGGWHMLRYYTLQSGISLRLKWPACSCGGESGQGPRPLVTRGMGGRHRLRVTTYRLIWPFHVFSTCTHHTECVSIYWGWRDLRNILEHHNLLSENFEAKFISKDRSWFGFWARQ